MTRDFLASTADFVAGVLVAAVALGWLLRTAWRCRPARPETRLVASAAGLAQAHGPVGGTHAAAEATGDEHAEGWGVGAGL